MHSDARPGINLIRAYANGELIVNETNIHSSLSLSADSLLLLPDLKCVADLSDRHATIILDSDPEVILLGTGARQEFPAAAWSANFLQRSVGVEAMTTAAACRTYNVLASEHRRVTAVLIV